PFQRQSSGFFELNTPLVPGETFSYEVPNTTYFILEIDSSSSFKRRYPQSVSEDLGSQSLLILYATTDITVQVASVTHRGRYVTFSNREFVKGFITGQFSISSSTSGTCVGIIGNWGVQRYIISTIPYGGYYNIGT